MTPEEAFEIIQRISMAVDTYEKTLAIPLSALPCSLGRAKYAFLLYLEYIIKYGPMTQQQGDALKASYSLLGRFIFDKDAVRLNEIKAKILSKSATTEETQMFMYFYNRTFAAMFEINSYINDLFGKRDNEDVMLDILFPPSPNKPDASGGKVHQKILVDSCVFIDAFDESSHNYDISHKFLDWTVQNRIIITMPAHAWFEIWCTLRRLERIDQTFKGRSVRGNWSYPIELIHIDQAFIEKYGNVDIRYIKSGDHIFLVIAKVNDYPMVTTDDKMREVAKDEGIRVFGPQEFMNL